MNDWEKLKTRLERLDFAGGRVLIGLDFDGTLADIVETPAEAFLGPATRRLLLALRRRPDTKLAVLSGRALDDVRRLVGLSGVYYGGNHGLELSGPGVSWSHPATGPVARSVFEDIEQVLRVFPGAALEHKGLGAAIHYRQVAQSHHERLRDRLKRRFHLLRDRFRLLHGKKTYDLRSKVAWNKGNALGEIRRHLAGGWMALFIGDDVTDEEAFRTLGPRALTVRVGRVKRSAAEYVLPHRRLVDRMLEILARRSAGEMAS